jgi:hypothetical protein
MMRLKEVAEKLTEEQLLNCEYFWLKGSVEGSLTAVDWDEALRLAASGKPLDELSAAELQVLQLHMDLHGASPVEEEALVAILRECSALTGAEIRLGLDALERGGFLFALGKAWGERFIFAPSDLYAALLPCLSPLPASSPCCGDVYPAASLQAGPVTGATLPLGRALLYGLSQLSREPSAGFTAKGALSRKMSDRLERAFPFSRDVLQLFGFGAKEESGCSPSVALLLEAALGLRLLLAGDKGFCINEHALELWLEQDEQAREMELRSWLCDLIFPAVGAAAHCGARMCRIQDGSWRRVQDLYEEPPFRDDIAAGEGREPVMEQRQYAQNWLDLFYTCGWLESGYIEGEKPEAVFRWRPFSHVIENEVMLQPDGEMLAGPQISGSIRWQLEEIADRVSDDWFTLYRLSENRLHWNMGRGAHLEEIEAILQNISGRESLPEAVHNMLQQWYQSWVDKGSKRSSFCGIEKSGPPKAGESLQSSHAPQPCFLEIIRHPNQQRSQQFPGIPQQTVPMRLEQDRAWLYRLEKNRDMHHAFSEKMAAVPAMWLKQRRSYHPSTSRELIAKAISLETAVELSLEGRSVLFIPEATEQRGNEWAVIGRLYGERNLENHVFGPEQWDEIRLVLPTEAANGRKRQ